MKCHKEYRLSESNHFVAYSLAICNFLLFFLPFRISMFYLSSYFLLFVEPVVKFFMLLLSDETGLFKLRMLLSGLLDIAFDYFDYMTVSSLSFLLFLNELDTSFLGLVSLL